MTDFNFAPVDPWRATSAALTELLDRAIEDARNAEPPRKYLGASMMGNECLRAVAYEWHDSQAGIGKEFPGKLYRVFDMGHDGEARMASYLQMAGFDLRTKNAQGEDYGYCVADGRMQGHIDGVILAGPAIGCAWPALWENKALNDKGWNEVSSQGVRKRYPKYFGQMQVYMAYLDLPRALFTAINRDTGEIYAEIVEFDQAAAQALSDRGVRVIGSASPDEFPRIGRDETDFRCRFCDYHARCWATPNNQPVKEAPGWLTKKKG